MNNFINLNLTTMKKEWSKPKLKQVSVDDMLIEKVLKARKRVRDNFTANDIVYFDKLDFIINVLIKVRSELQVQNRLSKKEKANIKMMYIMADQLNDL